MSSRQQPISPENVVQTYGKRRGNTVRKARENHVHQGIEDALAALLGTTDEIIVTDNLDGTFTLSLADNPIIKGATANRISYTDGDKKLQSIANLATWIAGTANQVIVTSDGDGTITLSTPQNIHSGASPTFAGLTTTGARVQNITRLTSGDSPYSVIATDHVILCQTDGGAIEVDLPAGLNGRELRILNVGSSGNNVTVDPNGTEELYNGGAGVAFAVYDSESITINFEATENWW